MSNSVVNNLRMLVLTIEKSVSVGNKTEIPDEYKLIFLDDVLDPGVFNPLSTAYREIYGSDERNREDQVIWGEGAYCNKEGWVKLIPLVEYVKRRDRGDLDCRCGGVYELCYPDDTLTQRIVSELSTGEQGDYPFCVINQISPSLPVHAFTWGAVCSPSGIVLRLIKARYENSNQDKVEQVRNFETVLVNLGVSKCLFFDEMAVVPDKRRGIAPVQYLTILSLRHVVRFTKFSLFWTVKRSPIHLISRLMGYDEIFEIDNLVFLLNSDICLLLSILESREPLAIQTIMAHNLRILRK